MANLVAVLFVLASGFAHYHAQDSPPDSTYVALGDSIAAGIGSSLPRDHSYPAILGELFSSHIDAPIRTENLAEPGASAAGFLTSDQYVDFTDLIDDVESIDAPILGVTLTLGGNDVLDLRNASDAERGVALAEFETAMPAVVTAIRETIGPDTPLYVSTIYDPTLQNAAIESSDAWWIARFNEAIRMAAAESDAVLVDLAESLGDEARELTRYPADVHPTNAGHARIAAEFWQATGLDTEAPEIELLVEVDDLRRTPTIRFVVSPDTLVDTIRVRSGDDRVIVHPPVEVSDFEFVALIIATGLDADSAELQISARDAAGNATELPVVLSFAASR